MSSYSDLPAIGEPIVVHIGIFADTHPYSREFTIPFKLVSQDEYLFWLYEVLREVKCIRKEVCEYMLNYLRLGKVAADEQLTARVPEAGERDEIIFNCKSIASCVCQNRALGVPVSLMEDWREAHCNNFRLGPAAYVTFLTKWANYLADMRAKGTLNQEQYFILFEAHSFNIYERNFLELFAAYDVDRRILVDAYFRRLRVDSINLADRVTEDFPKVSYMVELLHLKPKANAGALLSNTNVKCTYCHKPNMTKACAG